MPQLTRQDRQLLALTRAAKNQPDPVKRAKIMEKINKIKQKKVTANWLSQ